MPTGEELIEAIVGSQKIRDMNQCPLVSVGFGNALYGAGQNDTGSGFSISNTLSANLAVACTEMAGKAAVWHFLLSPVHHFVVVAWYRQGASPGMAFTIFMAYENQYSVADYIESIQPAATSVGGRYRASWNGAQIATMLTELLADEQAWIKYFGTAVPRQTTEITVWKYPKIDLATAIANVGAY